MPYIERCHNSYTSYELCPVLENQFGKPSAYILQLLHYWLRLENLSWGIICDGFQWFYNSHGNWLKKLNQNKVYISLSSIRRGLEALEAQGIVLARCFEVPGNNVNSYTIDYDRLESVVGVLSTTLLKNRPCSVLEISQQQKTLSYKNSNSFTFDEQAQGAKPVQMSRPINRYITKKPLNNFSSDQNEHAVSLAHIHDANHGTQQQEKINISEEMIRLWNEIVEENETFIALTPQRACYLTTAFNQFFNRNFEQWVKFCCKIASSKFLMGETQKSNWRIDLDWALKFNKLQLIQEGKRYTFGDRLVIYKTQKLKKEGVNNQTSTENVNRLHESSEALKVRFKLQEILKKNYLDDNGLHYASWFKDTYIEMQENENHIKTCYLYAKNRFIKDQLYIRYRDLCEKLFDEIRIGLPQTDSELSKQIIPTDIHRHASSKNEPEDVIESEHLDKGLFERYSPSTHLYIDDLPQALSSSEDRIDSIEIIRPKNTFVCMLTDDVHENELIRSIDTPFSDHISISFNDRGSHLNLENNKAGSFKYDKNDSAHPNYQKSSMMNVLHDIKELTFKKKIKTLIPETLYLKWFHEAELCIEKGRWELWVSSLAEKQRLESDLSTFTDQLPLDILIQQEALYVEDNHISYSDPKENRLFFLEKSKKINNKETHLSLHRVKTNPLNEKNNTDTHIKSKDIDPFFENKWNEPLGVFKENDTSIDLMSSINTHEKIPIERFLFLYLFYKMTLGFKSRRNILFLKRVVNKVQELSGKNRVIHEHFVVFMFHGKNFKNKVYQPPPLFYGDKNKHIRS